MIQVVVALISLVCFLVQIICILSIFYEKVKYFLDEKKLKCLDFKRQKHPIDHIDENLSPDLELRKRQNQIETSMKNENEKRATDRQPHAFRGDSIVILNNSPYNKILIDVFLIVFALSAIAINLIGVVVKKNLDDGESVYKYSKTLLCFLDLAPRILFSIVLPFSIHIRNPEILKHTKSMFQP